MKDSLFLIAATGGAEFVWRQIVLAEDLRRVRTAVGGVSFGVDLP